MNLSFFGLHALFQTQILLLPIPVKIKEEAFFSQDFSIFLIGNVMIDQYLRKLSQDYYQTQEVSLGFGRVKL